MKVIILAAGYGTRLYPLTKDMPKALLKVAGRTILEHILNRVEEVPDIDKIFIVTNEKFYKSLLEWKEKYKSRIGIEIINDKTNSNEERLGAIGDIHYVVSARNIDEDILIVGSDNLFEFSIAHLNRFFKEKKSSVIALFDIKEKSKAANKYGIVHTDLNHKVLEFHEKPTEPKTSLVSTACYILSKQDLRELEECIKSNNKLDNLGEFIKYLAQRKHIYGYIFSERWFDIGSHEQLKEAEEYWSGKN